MAKETPKQRAARIVAEREADAALKLETWLGRLERAVAKVRHYQKKMRYYARSGARQATDAVFDPK